MFIFPFLILATLLVVVGIFALSAARFVPRHRRGEAYRTDWPSWPVFLLTILLVGITLGLIALAISLTG